MLYEKQFGFRSGYSTNNGIVQLFDKIFDSLGKEHFTLWVFIDLLKAFDTVYYSIILKNWNFMAQLTIESFLSNKKHYINVDENKKTYLKYVTCTVPQESIVWPLLFLVYDNDLPNVFHLLDPIMFTKWY